MDSEKKERPQDFLRRVLRENPKNENNLEALYLEYFETPPKEKFIDRIKKEWQSRQVDPLESRFGKKLNLSFDQDEVIN